MTTKTSDEQDNQFLARAALTGGMGGMGIGGLISLAYMLAEASKDKARAKDKQEEVKNLSPYIATTGVPKMSPKMSEASAKRANDDDVQDVGLIEGLGNMFQAAGHGMWMIPAAATAATVPAWLAFKFMKDKYETSRTAQLSKELEVAREEFRQALRSGTKLSSDIDNVIDSQAALKHATDIKMNYPKKPDTDSNSPAKSPYDVIGGAPGIVGGTLGVTGLLSAYLTYKLLDSRHAKRNPKVQALRAMKELQQRRKALSEIDPTVRIQRDDSGSLYPSI